jgi:hypothetical protein
MVPLALAAALSACATEALPPPAPPPDAYTPPPPRAAPPPPPSPDETLQSDVGSVPGRVPPAPVVPPGVLPRPAVTAPGARPVNDVLGRPPFTFTSPLGYWIWVDAFGNWHLRTTRGPLTHTFQGRVLASRGGVLTAFRPKAIRPGDGLQVGSGAISFQFQPYEPFHGFIWRSTSGCVRFELFIDGRPLRRVYLGSSAVRAESNVFERCQ